MPLTLTWANPENSPEDLEDTRTQADAEKEALAKEVKYLGKQIETLQSEVKDRDVRQEQVLN